MWRLNIPSQEEKKQFFISELLKLKNNEYISEEHFVKIMKAYNRYYTDIDLEQLNQKIENELREEVEQNVPKVEKTIKKRATPEQIREKNITWLLNLGVILLLIGGLFVATSNWDTMSDLLKASSIAFVSVLFYGMAFISKKILKIERTTFAFIVLGSLFLPIFILSIGWFELLGPYFSFYGEGRNILGALGSLIIIPIYGLLAKQLKSRLFVWFSYISITAFVSYFLAALHFEQDWFYLGMIVYNALLVVCFHWFKKRESFSLFTKELIYFSQINLILSTFFMLIFFNHAILYGFNIFLTATVYLSMVYVTGRKEFHFVFSVMIVYGAYQLIEHSMLDQLHPILYAFVGAAFLAVPKIMDKEYNWEKVFRFTSAIVSILAFIYISIEGILLKMDKPSIALVFAYFMIAIQFIYLANTMNKRLFSYLSSVFIASAFLEVVLILNKIFVFERIMLPIFLIGFLLFLIFGYVLKQKFIKIILASSRDVGIGIMLFSVFISIFVNRLDTGIMLLLLSLIFLLANQVEERNFYRKLTPWAMPISFGLAFAVFGEEMRNSFLFYQVNLSFATNAILGSLPVFLLSYVWKYKENEHFRRNSFFIAQGFYTLAILAAIFLPVNEIWMRPLILLAGGGLYISFYLFTKFKWLSYAIPIVSLSAYFAIIYSLQIQHIELGIFDWMRFALGGFILLAISYFLLKKEAQLAKGFAWIAHIYLPFALLVSLIIYWEKSIWCFIIAIAVYWICSRKAEREWKVKLFLYSAFLSSYIVFLTGIEYVIGWKYTDYAYLLTSITAWIVWIFVKDADRRRISYFIIPFSLLGIISFMVGYPFEIQSFIMMVLYAGGLIFFLHKIRKDIIVGVPLILIFIGACWFLITGGIEASIRPILVGIFGIALTICGQLLYRQLFSRDGKLIQIDSYSITAFLFFTVMFTVQTEALWSQAIPGLLLSSLFYLQRKRVPSMYSWLPLILTGIQLLQPYYAVIGKISVPNLVETELNVLPFVAVIIFVRVCLKAKFRKITSSIEWAILLIVSLILISDGLNSSTIYDAIILGSLSLISLLSGMFLRVKSYFFIGTGVLLLNILLQTRPFWGNLPWWAYLLIAGTILIAVASYNEWHKQKQAKGEQTIISKWKNSLMNKWKEWK